MTQHVLTIDSVVHRPDGVMSTQTSDETLILNSASGTCFALNGPSARIWALMETPISVRQLVRRLVEEYEIAEPECLDQTLVYLGKLVGEGIVIASDAAASHPS